MEQIEIFCRGRNIYTAWLVDKDEKGNIERKYKNQSNSPRNKSVYLIMFATTKKRMSQQLYKDKRYAKIKKKYFLRPR